MEKVKVAVLGGSGYTAVELLKLLLRHPHAEVAAVTSPTCTPSSPAGSTGRANPSTRMP